MNGKHNLPSQYQFTDSPSGSGFFIVMTGASKSSFLSVDFFRRRLYVKII